MGFAPRGTGWPGEGHQPVVAECGFRPAADPLGPELMGTEPVSTQSGSSLDRTGRHHLAAWRPIDDAQAVAVAICWHDTTQSISGRCGLKVPAVAQVLLLRVLTTNASRAGGGSSAALGGDLTAYSNCHGAGL